MEPSVLFVCTGNICRSPIAEVMLRAIAGPALSVGSAGLLFDGRAASDGAIAWGDTLGFDLRLHRSQVISRDLVGRADLVLGMEPRHVREVVALSDAAWTRTFTLREFEDRVTGTARGADESLGDWLERIGTGRRRIDLLGDDPELIIPDPYGCTLDVYERTAERIAVALETIVGATWPRGFGGAASAPLIDEEPSRRTA